MGFSKDDIKNGMRDAWRRYIRQVEFSLRQLEKEIQKAGERAGRLTEDRARQVDRISGEIYEIVFSIGEPHWANTEDTELLRNLKERVCQFDSQLQQLKLNGQ